MPCFLLIGVPSLVVVIVLLVVIQLVVELPLLLVLQKPVEAIEFVDLDRSSLLLFLQSTFLQVVIYLLGNHREPVGYMLPEILIMKVLDSSGVLDDCKYPSPPFHIVSSR